MRSRRRNRLRHQNKCCISSGADGFVRLRAVSMTELYKLHTPFVVAFLAFVVVFVVAHVRR
jgi:hypothetical protein